jgi:hypothetical protein
MICPVRQYRGHLSLCSRGLLLVLSRQQAVPAGQHTQLYKFHQHTALGL